MGRDAAGGVFDETRDWWTREGKALTEQASKTAADAAVDAASDQLAAKYETARKMLEDQWAARVAEAQRAADEGKATFWQQILLFLAAGGSAGAFQEFLGRVGKKAIADAVGK